MSTRNVSAIFEPESIVLIGASDEPHSVGSAVASNLLAARFPGRLIFVNPRIDCIAGQTAARRSRRCLSRPSSP